MGAPSCQKFLYQEMLTRRVCPVRAWVGPAAVVALLPPIL